jgi:ArsR family transcriptional regulator
MDERQAVEAFSGLAQETRLAILRLLVKAGPAGLASGAIGEAVGVAPSNASFHLAHLERAGLVQARRRSRSIIYCADFDRLAGLIRFLMEDCCGGDPALMAACGPAVVRC